MHMSYLSEVVQEMTFRNMVHFHCFAWDVVLRESCCVVHDSSMDHKATRKEQVSEKK